MEVHLVTGTQKVLWGAHIQNKIKAREKKQLKDQDGGQEDPELTFSHKHSKAITT